MSVCNLQLQLLPWNWHVILHFNSWMYKYFLLLLQLILYAVIAIILCNQQFHTIDKKKRLSNCRVALNDDTFVSTTINYRLQPFFRPNREHIAFDRSTYPFSRAFVFVFIQSFVQFDRLFAYLFVYLWFHFRRSFSITVTFIYIQSESNR